MAKKLQLCISLLLFSVTLCAQLKEQPKILTLKTIKIFKYEDWPLKETFLQELVDLFHVDIFIETGTYRGITTEQAAHYFKEVHSIELSYDIYKETQLYLNMYPNIHLYHGDSTYVLPELLKRMNKRIAFWLDGHYSGGPTAIGSKNTPIIDELIAIKNSGIKDAIILIDDIRCFQTVDNAAAKEVFKGYPSVEELEQAVLDINQDYQFYILGDIAIAWPRSDNVTVSPVIQACTISRLSDTKKIAEEKIIAAENVIASAQGEEKEAITFLCARFGQSGLYYGLCGHIFLWNALILEHQGERALAAEYEQQAHAFGVYRHSQSK